MKLSDEQISAIMQKEIKSKCLICNNDEVSKKIQEHELDGWILLNKIEINGRTKLTFKK